MGDAGYLNRKIRYDLQWKLKFKVVILWFSPVKRVILIIYQQTNIIRNVWTILLTKDRHWSGLKLAMCLTNVSYWKSIYVPINCAAIQNCNIQIVRCRKLHDIVDDKFQGSVEGSGWPRLERRRWSQNRLSSIRYRYYWLHGYKIDFKSRLESMWIIE